MIELSIAEYESIRSSPVRFPVKLGHDYPEFERVRLPGCRPSARDVGSEAHD